jgi:hypothetical protein
MHQVNGHIISELEKAPIGQLWCKPIPLTEEILLKCGFEKSSNLFFCNINNFSYLKANAYGCNGNFGYCISDEKEIYVEVKYLHHLQNLTHALTGEELEVNL